MAFWLFADLFFKLLSGIQFLGVFSVDSGKLWIRNTSEDFSTVLNGMLAFKQFITMCSIFSLHFWYGFLFSFSFNFFFKISTLCSLGPWIVHVISFLSSQLSA